MIDHALSEEDMCLLEIVNQAYDKVMLKKIPDLESNLSNSENILALTQIGVKYLISFFRLNTDFQSLTNDLQIVLIKKCIVESLLIQATISYNSMTNCFDDFLLNPILSSKTLENEYGSLVYGKIMRLIKDFYNLTEGNHLILKIMLLTILFTPNNIEIDFYKRICISKLNVKYTRLLYSYMQFKFGLIESELKLSNYLCYLQDIFTISTLIRCHKTSFNYE